MKMTHLMLLSLFISSQLMGETKLNTQETKEIIKIGTSTSTKLLKKLQSALKKSIHDGGISKALDFCAQEAYTLTQNVNEKLPQGVSVKRVSVKNRNPVNSAKEDENLVLTKLQEQKSKGEELPPFVIEKIGEKEYKFYKPLLISKPLCLECHGKLQNIDIRRKIASLYPLDKAKKYKLHDLRGAIVVHIQR